MLPWHVPFVYGPACHLQGVHPMTPSHPCFIPSHHIKQNRYLLHAGARAASWLQHLHGQQILVASYNKQSTTPSVCTQRGYYVVYIHGVTWPARWLL